MPPSSWSAHPYAYAQARRLAEELGISRVTATVLVRRGYDAPGSARRFLAADERHDPERLAGIRAACESILSHVRRGVPIAIHGDYDVDGISSTAILVRALRVLGADPRWYIPARSEGYGLGIDTVRRLAAEGTRLLLTADCGITAAAEIAEARALGMEVVVTDHHRPPDELPDCPIVHPAVSGYPCTDLCAAGVAHKVAEVLFRLSGRDPNELDCDLDLVALATVADVVPLRGENRRLVRSGLAQLAHTTKPGLRALMAVAGVDPGSVDEHALGFRLGPRLNAAGRLAHAEAALELLMTDDLARAREVADELDLLNRERQDTETRILFAAEAARAEDPDAPAYVLAGEGWHPGVIGIVAGRLVERYHRPCVVIALDGEVGRGSCRSIPAYDVHAGLAASAAHLLRFGGHRAAAGLEVERSRVDDFRAALCAHAAAWVSPDDLIPVEPVDAVISADAVSVALAEELGRLGPFGHGNPTPTLLVPAAQVSDVRAMGEEGQHSRFTLCGGGGRARVVAFRTAARSLTDAGADPHDAAVRLELNEWRGTVEPRLILRALCPTQRGSVSILGDDEFWYALAHELEAPLEPGESDMQMHDCTPGRTVEDRRGTGVAGLLCDTVSSGESVLVVCADTARRRAAIERVVGRAAAVCPEVAMVTWDALRLSPQGARRFDHVIALDPPYSASVATLAERPSGSGGGFLHLAWGPDEVRFALAVARRSLSLRAELAALYRALRSTDPCEGPALEAALRGNEGHPRSPFVAGRLVRVLGELELIEFELEQRRCALAPPRQSELTRSLAYRTYEARLASIERYLGRPEVAQAA